MSAQSQIVDSNIYIRAEWVGASTNFQYIQFKNKQNCLINLEIKQRSARQGYVIKPLSDTLLAFNLPIQDGHKLSIKADKCSSGNTQVDIQAPSVLPIRFVRFEAKYLPDGTIQVLFVTERVYNVSRIEVEISENGITYNKYEIDLHEPIQANKVYKAIVRP